MIAMRRHIICLILLALPLSSLAGPAVPCIQDNGQPSSRETVIDAVEKGWEHGDGQPFRQHYLDFEGARYVESGGQNTSLTELIEHHVEPEGDSLENFELDLSNVETHVEGHFAWAIADVNLQATIKSEQREIHYRGYETFLFRRIDEKWMIIHTHSSTRPVKSE